MEAQTQAILLAADDESARPVSLPLVGYDTIAAYVHTPMRKLVRHHLTLIATAMTGTDARKHGLLPNLLAARLGVEDAYGDVLVVGTDQSYGLSQRQIKAVQQEVSAA